jgi:hypothetical protein
MPTKRQYQIEPLPPEELEHLSGQRRLARIATVDLIKRRC